MASDSDSDEDFVNFGTPLEPLEEDEPLKKPVPLHEQTVKDEKGRYKRFHGAFTGGFSAGYFNTVGSKEGWAPSTFVSSRQQKAEKNHARPEDFMDEEDFSEHGIAPREITTSQEFSSSRRDEAREKARAVNAQTALIPGDTLLEELIAPARSSIGVELLRRMGWKEGQGVGPRVKRKPRRQQTESYNTSHDAARLYGCALPPAGSEDSEDDDDDDFAPENVTFAPKDVTPVDFNPRLGVQGLGYRGLDPGLALLGQRAAEHIDLFKPQSETRSRLFGDTQRRSRRGGVAGQAFGVGALEDDDDEDVYHRDSMSRYDRELGGEEPGDGLYGWTAPQQYTKKRDKSKDASYLGKILEGFTLAQKPAEEKTIFPPPALPRDYRPVHRFQPSLNMSGLSGVSPALAEALRVSRGHMVKEEPQQGGRHQLDSGQRRALLGEDALQGPSSVLELLRPEDRERLLNLRNSSNPPSAKTTTTTATTDSRDALRSAGSLSGALALTGLVSSGLQQQQQEALVSWRGVQTSSQTFRPFEKTPSKQARYELYLNFLKQGDKDALEQSLDPGMTEWERSRERDEFVRASILYRPTSSSLSSRFTRSKNQEDEDTVEVSRDQEGDVDDKQAAVNMKMFGKLTRETFEWHPDKLLCKRFNVPDPHPGSGLVGLPKVKRDKFSVFNFLTVTESREATAPPKPPEPAKKSRWDVSDQKEEKKKSDALSELLSAARDQTETKLDQTSVPAPPALPAPPSRDQTETRSGDQQSSDMKKEGDEEEEEEEEESRPPMDLFKAIFASSSDEKSSSSEGESEEEEEDTKEDEGKTEPQAVKLFSISNVTSNTSSSVTSSSVTSTSVTSTSVTSSSSTSNQQTAVASTQEEFGPKLPPPSAAHIRGGASSLCSPSEEEKPSRRRREDKEKKHKNKKQHKHKKEKKKKKHKKHKHKVKQQKKSKKEESDSSSEDSDEGGDHGDGQVLTEELLKRLKSARSHETW
ncbi:G patch domain-containing protein 1 [Seriola dumerili]|uniref:G patch domain containing 1 n=1 Tax=Seriola dumerili TaxID=41447 RepID=A0A3B4TWR7_SERDU|nr:G patch domain-containing protein 1 [Seriola dumerili]